MSIYFGGGTPSLWRPDCIARAIETVVGHYGARAAGLEITLEANPRDCEPDHLAAWRSAGVNRISIGVQSLAADELVVLGRDHRFGDGPAALARVIASGGFAVSCDFILGTPVPGAASGNGPAWIPSILATAVDHLSVYELTIEDRTAFGRRVGAGRLVPLDEDTLTTLYLGTHEALTAGGFEHYEISSYARPGKRARHNSLYWSGAPFLGLGVGAASLYRAPDGSAERETNPRRAADYLSGAAPEVVAIPPSEMAMDTAWLGLRTKDGVPAGLLASAPGVIAWLVEQGLAEVRQDRICPTLRGFLMADRIAARIVSSWG